VPRPRKSVASATARQGLTQAGDELAVRDGVLQRATLRGEVRREEPQQVEAQRITRHAVDVVLRTFHCGSILRWAAACVRPTATAAMVPPALKVGLEPEQLPVLADCDFGR
jgi:hypothetical protein